MTMGQPAQARAAGWYREKLGWSVIPLHGVKDGRCTCGDPACDSPGKHPLGPWTHYQQQLATLEQIARWWRGWPQANVAIVTGGVSGVIVLDVDGEEGMAQLQGRALPPTPCVDTGKGRHYYFAHPGGRIPNKVRVAPGLDIRADGGYVVAPPSVHVSGRVYRWRDGLWPHQVPPAPPPDWLLEAIRAADKPEERPARTPDEEWARLLLEGVDGPRGGEPGTRNDTAARLAGYLLRHNLPAAVVGAILLNWNRLNRPPLPEDEVLRVVRSIAGREEIRRRGVAS